MTKNFFEYSRELQEKAMRRYEYENSSHMHDRLKYIEHCQSTHAKLCELLQMALNGLEYNSPHARDKYAKEIQTALEEMVGEK